jgi:phosphate transport system substrate-binding protein
MKYILVFIISCAVLSSCGFKEDITKKDSPTSGNALLFFDEGLTLHIKNQIYTFKTTYKYADIILRTSNEKECIEALYNDSSKVIAISRPLTKKELSQFKTKNIYPQTSFVAGDAIAFVVSKAFPDSTISLAELTNLLKGNDSILIQHKHVNVVFDNANSGSTRQLKDSLMPNSAFGRNCSTVNNTHELIKSVASNSLSIGVCDFAWLSDFDDNTTKEFLKSVKILAVSKNNNETAYMPDQSNIATKAYPLCRTICIIRRSAEFSLGKGIETFIAGPKGQLMFLKQGLPPNRQEERLIEVDMTPLK